MFSEIMYFQHSDLGPESKYEVCAQVNGDKIFISHENCERFSIYDILQIFSDSRFVKAEFVDCYIMAKEFKREFKFKVNKK